MIRMALHKAGVDFEDRRLTGPEFGAMKKEGKFDFNQVPMLQLADGTQLVQSVPIFNYLGNVYKLKPEDPMVCYVAAKCVALAVGDFFQG